MYLTTSLHFNKYICSKEHVFIKLCNFKLATFNEDENIVLKMISLQIETTKKVLPFEITSLEHLHYYAA